MRLYEVMDSLESAGKLDGEDEVEDVDRPERMEMKESIDIRDVGLAVA